MRATIVTHHIDLPSAKAIERSLTADNEAAPRPLRIKSRANGTRVTSTIEGAGDVESLLTTIDDLLLCLIAADKLLTTIQVRKLRRPVGSRVADYQAPKV